MYSYVIKVADSESAFGFYNKELVSEKRVLNFIRIKNSIHIEKLTLLFNQVWYLFSSVLCPFSNIISNNKIICKLKIIFSLIFYLLEFTL